MGLTVVAAFLLGRLQSDINWKRDIIQREKEQKEKEENELNLRRVDALRVLIEILSKLSSLIEPINNSNGDYIKELIWIPESSYEAGEELLIELEKVIPLFPYEHEIGISAEVLLSLKNYTINTLPNLERYAKHKIPIMEDYADDFLFYYDELIKSRAIFQQTVEELVKDFG